MADENARLKNRLVRVESENNVLKGSNITFTFPVLQPALLFSDNRNFLNRKVIPLPSLIENPSTFNNNQQQPDISMYDFEDLNINSTAAKPVSPTSISDASAKANSSIHSPNIPVSTRAQNLMLQYHDFTQHNPGVASPVSPDDGHNYFDCPKVWERIVMHPRFDEVDDVEALCSQLNSKVRIVRPL